jgi:hypothetical protein
MLLVVSLTALFQVLCVSKRQPIYARFHFMDGEYRALVFDAAATTNEVRRRFSELKVFITRVFRASFPLLLRHTVCSHVAKVITMVKERIGLSANVQGFSLFEVFGALERNMLGWEKVSRLFV